ncbi:C39 family peptidase [bacterium]|nr:C39 family peptidase [bacterium]
MKIDIRLYFEILRQPDDITCGPTCLHAVYRYFGYDIPLEQVISEVKYLEEGGTLAVYLGLHALEHGFRATLYTYNLQVFDPTWFLTRNIDLREKLAEQIHHKKGVKFQQASRAYLDFLKHGGKIRFEDLTARLLRKHLKKEKPVLTGLSATYLYNCSRERSLKKNRIVYDDIRGEPMGHFVVLTGYEQEARSVWIADPQKPNPLSDSAEYSIQVNRLICAIMLGILTYDANLLIIEPDHTVKGNAKLSRRIQPQ